MLVLIFVDASFQITIFRIFSDVLMSFDWCIRVKVKLYLTSFPDDQQSENNSSASAVESSGVLLPLAVDVGPSAAQLSDFEDDTSDPDDDLSETDDDDDLWTCVSAVLQQTRVWQYTHSCSTLVFLCLKFLLKSLHLKLGICDYYETTDLSKFWFLIVAINCYIFWRWCLTPTGWANTVI